MGRRAVLRGAVGCGVMATLTTTTTTRDRRRSTRAGPIMPCCRVRCVAMGLVARLSPLDWYKQRDVQVP